MAAIKPSVVEEAQVVIKPPADVHPRLEIRDLLNKESLKWQRGLFLLALRDLMAVPAKLATSFYQIAGIHGRPYLPYDRVGPEEVDDSKWGGYCWHGSQLFPTWHRPYMMLVEQELRVAASARVADWEAEVKGNPDAQKALDSFKTALEELRLPYLDWGSIETLKFGLPDELCSIPEVTVQTPLGEETFPNPLLAAVLPEDVGDVVTISPAFNPLNRPNYKVPGSGIDPYTPKGYATVRYPDNNYNSQPYNLLRQTLQAVPLVFRPGLSYMFALDKWSEFSNHTTGALRPDPSTGRKVSLEGVHDQVHDTFGGEGGHMGYSSLAAFDPIFYLHHANVDRLLALWQAVYDDPNKPATWIQKQDEPRTRGTWTAPASGVTDENTPLTPFRKRQQKIVVGKIDQSDTEAFYTSKDVRTLENLGYTYPELLAWQGLSPAQKLTKINEMYTMSEYTGYQLHADFTGIDKQQLKGPFSINVFVGYDSYKPTAETPTKDNPHFAGSLSVFTSAPASTAKCSGCQNPARQKIDGSVNLTSALLRVGPDSDALKWSPADLTEDASHKDLPPWAQPPVLPAGSLRWKDIGAAVQNTIQYVVLRSDGSEAHHLSMDGLSVSWSRPYRLSAAQQKDLAAEARKKIAFTAEDGKLLPAPVWKFIMIESQTEPNRAEFAATESRRAAAGGPSSGDLLFVALPKVSSAAE